MKKEEAEKQIVEWIQNRKKVHCPMYGGNIIDFIFGKRCRVNCICMNEMRILETYNGSGNWYTIGGYCTCHSLTGNV